MAFLYLVAKMDQPSMMLVYIAQFVKSTGVIVATGYMWALVPEVISYGEYKSGKRIAGIVNALTGIFFKAGMTLGSVVAPAILAYVAYNPKAVEQTLRLRRVFSGWYVSFLLPCCCSPSSLSRSMS